MPLQLDQKFQGESRQSTLPQASFSVLIIVINKIRHIVVIILVIAIVIVILMVVVLVIGVLNAYCS